jgi:cytochrome c-type biogenesis protein CcmH
MVAAESGNVTPQAVTEFNAVLELDGGDLKARYFLALAKQQSGKKTEAFETWRTLQAAPLDDEPWVVDKPGSGAQRGLAGACGGSKAPDRPGDPRALTAEEIGFARTLAADQQQAMIRGMVNASRRAT